MSVGDDLREMGVAEALMWVLKNEGSDHGISVAESVIIYLCGHCKCEEVDRLIELDVVDRYCVPLMEITLKRGKFRGMFPYLVYSARVFRVLAQSREYAEQLVAHERVVPLLQQASANLTTGPVQVESNAEGRAFALEALWSFARFRLWPCTPADSGHCGSDRAFLRDTLPPLLMDAHAGVRSAAAGLWAALNTDAVSSLLLVGQRIERHRRLPPTFWRSKVLVFLFPFLASSSLP